MEQHFVSFFSPGTFVNEVDQLPIESWDVPMATEMARSVVQRHGATPYAFQFTTRSRTGDELDSSVVGKSGMYFLGGNVRTLRELILEDDPANSILISNMECNGWARVIERNNSLRLTMPLNAGDVVLKFDPPKREGSA